MSQQDQYSCEEAIETLLKELNEGPFTKEKLEALCSEYPQCSETIRSGAIIWEGLAEVKTPAPSPVMDAGFYKMLSEFSAEQTNTAKAWWDLSWVRQNGFKLKWVAMAGVFLMGMASGVLFWPGESNQEITGIVQNNHRESADDFVALTSAESATERLMGIQQIKERDDLDGQIVQALNEILLHDENDNVRLSAIETMLYFADNPQVRECLIRAIPYQHSPLIQMTLAEVMIALNDPKAVKEIQQLLETQQLELEVKMKLEETIEILI